MYVYVSVHVCVSECVRVCVRADLRAVKTQYNDTNTFFYIRMTQIHFLRLPYFGENAIDLTHYSAPAIFCKKCI